MIPCHQPTPERNALIAKIAVPKKQEVGLGLTLVDSVTRSPESLLLLIETQR